MTESRKVAVALICATDDAVVVESLFRKLEHGGREVALITGVDRHPRLVGEAIDRVGDTGMVIACESALLDGPAMRRVEGVFSARRGPSHALVRLDISQPVAEMIAGIERAAEGFGRSQGRIRRRPSKDLHLREVVQINESSGIALPVVRLAPDEELDGDTARIQIPDNPVSTELVRRRKVAHQRERDRTRRPASPVMALDADLDFAGASTIASGVHGHHREPPATRELLTIGLIIAAGLLAVLATVFL